MAMMPSSRSVCLALLPENCRCGKFILRVNDRPRLLVALTVLFTPSLCACMYTLAVSSALPAPSLAVILLRPMPRSTSRPRPLLRLLPGLRGFMRLPCMSVSVRMLSSAKFTISLAVILGTSARSCCNLRTVSVQCAISQEWLIQNCHLHVHCLRALHYNKGATPGR